MTHPLILQLTFARKEFQRGLVGVTAEEALRRILPMNCISWNIGHLAWQEQRYWLWRGQGYFLLPEVNEKFANGAPACTPTLSEAWSAWEQITRAADPWLDQVTTEILLKQVTLPDGSPGPYFGNLLQRVIYHYWYHTGENAAIRQCLGHTDLPEFVGNIDDEAPFRPVG